jgi:hypothetical protein
MCLGGLDLTILGCVPSVKLNIPSLPKLINSTYIPLVVLPLAARPTSHSEPKRPRMSEASQKTENVFYSRYDSDDDLCRWPTISPFDGSNRHEWKTFRFRIFSTFRSNWMAYRTISHLHLLFMSGFAGPVRSYYLAIYHPKHATQTVITDLPQLEKIAKTVFDDIEDLFGENETEINMRNDEEFSNLSQGSTEWWLFYSEFINTAQMSGRISSTPTSQQPNPYLFADLKRKTRRELVDRIYLDHGLAVDWDTFISSCRRLDSLIPPHPHPVVTPRSNQPSSRGNSRCQCFAVPRYDGTDPLEWDYFRAKVITILQVDWNSYTTIEDLHLYFMNVFAGQIREYYMANYTESATQIVFSDRSQLEEATNSILDDIEKVYEGNIQGIKRNYNREFFQLSQGNMEWRTFYQKFIVSALRSDSISALPSLQVPNPPLLSLLETKTNKKLVNLIYLHHLGDVDWDTFVAKCRVADPIRRRRGNPTTRR